MEQENIKNTCPYCDGKTSTLITYKESSQCLRLNVLFDSENASLLLDKYSTDNSHASEKVGGFLFIYCPMCGRKL